MESQQLLLSTIRSIAAQASLQTNQLPTSILVGTSRFIGMPLLDYEEIPNRLDSIIPQLIT